MAARQVARLAPFDPTIFDSAIFDAEDTVRTYGSTRDYRTDNYIAATGRRITKR